MKRKYPKKQVSGNKKRKTLSITKTHTESPTLAPKDLNKLGDTASNDADITVVFGFHGGPIRSKISSE